MRFRVLGPLQVWTGSAWSPIRAGQQRVVLAVLLAEAGRVVSADRLVDEIWGERPPRSASTTLQGYVARLRRLLGTGKEGPLATHGRGYELTVREDEVDAAAFRSLVVAGRRALAAGDLEGALPRLTEGLALWRGPALADVPATPTVTGYVTRLEQSRLDALEARLDVLLKLDIHVEAAALARVLVDEHPLRESLWALLMRALYRGARRAEALDTYQRARRVLATELGLEPGPELRELQRAILADAPILAAPRPPTAAGSHITPAQLPADVAGFTGRQLPLKQLDELAGTTVVTVAGAAGVGKTALAVHWAHQVRDSFPDGQLYVNLRGYAAAVPLRPWRRCLGSCPRWAYRTRRSRPAGAGAGPPRRLPLHRGEGAAGSRRGAVGRRAAGSGGRVRGRGARHRPPERIPGDRGQRAHGAGHRRAFPWPAGPGGRPRRAGARCPHRHRVAARPGSYPDGRGRGAPGRRPAA